MRLSLKTAGRIAWRETRSSLPKFVFVVAAVALGVGAVSGVRGFSESIREMLYKEARTIMAADLTARQFVMPSRQQQQMLDDLGKQGVDRTVVTETVSMASALTPDATPVLVSLKAVDPTKYPYYGTVKLSPEMPLAEALTDDSIAAGEDVLIRLGIKVGDMVRLGGKDFRMSAMVLSEPDRMSGSLNLGLRVMLSREAFAKTGLMQLGSRAADRYLFKIEANGPTVPDVRQSIQDALPEAVVADSSQPHPLITRGLDRATTFLSLVSLIALIVGAIGVGMAMYAHLQQKMDTIAVMKSIGGTSTDIIRIYALQTMLLGLLGGIGGVLIGQVVEHIFPRLVSQLFTIKPEIGWHTTAAIQGIAVGILTTLLFTMPPLLAIRKIRPALILRREMAEAKKPLRERWPDVRGALGLGAAILLGLGGIAAWLAGSSKVGGYFAGGLSVSLVLLSIVAWLLLRGIREFIKRSPVRLSAIVRQGFANLYRQGNQAQAILVSLGLGVMFTLSVYLIQKSLVDEILQTAPPGAPNVFLIGVTAAQVDPIKDLIAKQAGVETPPELGPSVQVRIASVDGVPLEERLSGDRRNSDQPFVNRTTSVTWEEELPSDTKVLKGAWWKKDNPEPLAAVASDTAKAFDVRVGSMLDVEASGKMFRARVIAIHEVNAVRSTPVSNWVFNKSALAGLPVVYYGGVRMKPTSVGALQRVLYAKYPSVTAVNIADALQIVQQVVDQIALVIRFLSTFAILAGAIILAASVAGTRFRRVREVVILKTLGATRKQVGNIFSIEFLTLGAVAGLMGAILAGAFSNLVLTRLLEAKFHVDMIATVTCVALSALLANFAGWLASFRILSQKPLEVLRGE